MSEEIREVYKEGQENEDEFEENEELIEDEEDTFDEPEFSDVTEEPFDEDAEETAEFEARMQKRKARVRSRKRRRKILGVILIIVVFATLGTMCGKDIIRLNAENIALKKQQKELEEERDRLREEVKNAGNREYVQDQARKQFKLLNPGELLFTFEDEEK